MFGGKNKGHRRHGYHQNTQATTEGDGFTSLTISNLLLREDDGLPCCLLERPASMGLIFCTGCNPSVTCYLCSCLRRGFGTNSASSEDNPKWFILPLSKKLQIFFVDEIFPSHSRMSPLSLVGETLALCDLTKNRCCCSTADSQHIMVTFSDTLLTHQRGKCGINGKCQVL